MEYSIPHRMNEASARLIRRPKGLADLDNILPHIAQAARDAFAADTCAVLAFNPITGKFIDLRTALGNLHTESEALFEKPRSHGVTRQVLREGMVLVSDLKEAPEYQNAFTRREGIRSFAGLALRTRNRQSPLGVIYLDYRQVRDFSASDREEFTSFATHAALLLREIWLERHLQAVAHVGQEINHNLATVENLFQELQIYVDTVLDESHKLVLGTYQPQTNELNLHIREYQQTSRMSLPLRGAYQYVIETQQVLWNQAVSSEVEDIQLSLRKSSEETELAKSAIIAPLTLRDVPLGILSIQHSQPDAYDQEDVFVLQLLANYTSLALHNIRLYSSLIQLNETGQVLTQQIEAEPTLLATVEKIREATQADIVVLFPYDSVLHRFILPPHMTGTLLDPTYPKATILRPTDMAVLALDHGEPIFAKDSDASYAQLRGGYQENLGNFKDREQIRSAAIIPLHVEEVPVGVLFANFRQVQRFDTIQKLLIEGLAHYAAIAIKNSQAFGTLSQRRVRELEALQRIDRELSQALDFNSVLHTILKLAYERVPAEEASILLLNARTQMLETAAAIGLDAEASQKQKLLLQDARGITLWAVKEKKPIRVNNVHTDPLWRERYLSVSTETVSELDVPLLDGEKVIGVLNVESTQEGAFQQEDQDILLTLAGQAVLAIKNSQAYEREKRLAEEERVLNHISKEIIGQLDPKHIFDLIVEKSLELTGSTRGNLMIYDTDQGDLWMAAVRGPTEEKKGTRHSLEEGIVGYAASTKQTVNVEDLSQPPWNKVYLDFFPGTLSELAVPMLVGSELRGVLNVESVSPYNYDGSDERLLQGLADLAVIALKNADAFEREKRLVDEGQVLSEISRQITSQLDSVRVFDLILVKALELTRSTLGSLHLYNPRIEELTMVARRGVAEKKELRQRLGDGIVGQAAASRSLLNVPDVTQAEWNDAYIRLFQETRSELAVPMLAGGDLRGVLNVESTDLHHFKEADERLLQGLADLAVVALQNLEAIQARNEIEQRALEAEQMSAFGQYVFEVTHRLGNDLGVVDPYVSDIQSELEQLGLENAYIIKKLNNIRETVKSVLSFSGDLKQRFAKLFGKEETGEERVLLSPKLLLEEAAAAHASQPAISICLEVIEDAAHVQVFRNLVADILRNLITNAVQAMPDGGTITLRAYNEGRYAALQVSDTGIGISPQDLPKIFDLFVSKKKEKGGTGFGLWSARHNALKNGGDLKVESTPGQGTTFTLLLPRAGQRDVQ